MFLESTNCYKEGGKRTNNAAGARAEERSKGRRDENCVNDVNEAIDSEVISRSNERIVDVDFPSRNADKQLLTGQSTQFLPCHHGIT